MRNRTASKAEPPVARGATLAPAIHDALAVDELVILSLADDDAVYAVLEPVADALSAR